jgi:hypothetical protein
MTVILGCPDVTELLDIDELIAALGHVSGAPACAGL